MHGHDAKDRDGWDRRAVAAAVYSLGRKGRSTVAHMAVTHASADVRRACAWVLGVPALSGDAAYEGVASR